MTFDELVIRASVVLVLFWRPSSVPSCKPQGRFSTLESDPWTKLVNKMASYARLHVAFCHSPSLGLVNFVLCPLRLEL